MQLYLFDYRSAGRPDTGWSHSWTQPDLVLHGDEKPAAQKLMSSETILEYDESARAALYPTISGFGAGQQLREFNLKVRISFLGIITRALFSRGDVNGTLPRCNA
jgi:hypothetical protein